MRLIRLRLQNFRQHADTEIHFRRGLTGIIGPNGAGKSTILEAIAWAIYGASAARGTKDTIRFSRAPGRSRVIVELTFELGGHEYKVIRTLSGVDVYVDNGESPVASGTGMANAWLEKRLGMSREEFFNTYFTGQKELQFLASLGPTDRGRFLNQVLGYERLREAQSRIRERRNHLRTEILAIREILPDPDQLTAQRLDAEKRLKGAKSRLKDADTQLKAARKKLDQLAPRWTQIQQARERSREFEHEIEKAKRDGDNARRDLDRIGGELQTIEAAEKDLAPLRAQLAELPALEQRCAQLAELATLAARRGALEESERTYAAEFARSAERLKVLESAPELLKSTAAELDQLILQRDAAMGELAEKKQKWTEDRQDVRTKISTLLQLIDDLRRQLEHLHNTGPHGPCPMCTRPLGSEFDTVTGVLEEQLEKAVQDEKWQRKRETQLEKKKAELVAAEQEIAHLHKALELKTRRHSRCEQAVQELWNLARTRREQEEQLANVRAELEKLPTGYDPAEHKSLDAKLKGLREVEHRAARLEQLVESKAAREKEFEEATERGRAALASLQQAAGKLEQLDFSEERFEAMRKEFTIAEQDVNRLTNEQTEARARLEAAEEHSAGILQQEKAAEENRAKLHEIELDLRHHVELDNAFTQLRQELNARVRPELGELASIFLNDITDGRYTSLEIDESYNVTVLDEGEEKPVISGGEEDVANLVLRIAISQMIAERAGQRLSALFLDEVFGSLDLERRDNVIQLLHRLEDRFEQVVLITHIETIREGLDHTIRVTFDERTGSSVVNEEQVSPDYAPA